MDEEILIIGGKYIPVIDETNGGLKLHARKDSEGNWACKESGSPIVLQTITCKFHNTNDPADTNTKRDVDIMFCPYCNDSINPDKTRVINEKDLLPARKDVIQLYSELKAQTSVEKQSASIISKQSKAALLITFILILMGTFVIFNL
jgi:hypothetical protein